MMVYKCLTSGYLSVNRVCRAMEHYEYVTDYLCRIYGTDVDDMDDGDYEEGDTSDKGTSGTTVSVDSDTTVYDRTGISTKNGYVTFKSLDYYSSKPQGNLSSEPLEWQLPRARVGGRATRDSYRIVRARIDDWMK